jgi:hypothetical protein
MTAVGGRCRIPIDRPKTSHRERIARRAVRVRGMVRAPSFDRFQDPEIVFP